MTDDADEINADDDWVEIVGCYYCGGDLDAGAVELVFDRGEVEWICFSCAASLPRKHLEHDAERVEARDLQLLNLADRNRPIEDVPPNGRL